MLLFWHTQSESKELRTNIFLIQSRRLSKSRESLCRFSHWKFGYYTQKLWSLNNSWTSRSLRQNKRKSHLLLGLNKGPAFPHCPAMPVSKKEDPPCILGFHLYLQACIQESCNFTASERSQESWAKMWSSPRAGVWLYCAVTPCLTCRQDLAGLCHRQATHWEAHKKLVPAQFVLLRGTIKKLIQDENIRENNYL